MKSSSVTAKLSQARSGERVEAALEMEHDRAVLERELGDVCIRPLDRRRGAVGRDVAEAAAIATGRDVADAVECLARVRERLLERELVARRDEERMAGAALAELRR